MTLRLHRAVPLMALRIGLAAAALAAPMAAHAATATTTFNVTATVVATCSVSATSVALGSYSTGQLDGTGVVSVTCTNATGYTVALDAGSGTGATVASRKMTGPSSQTLTYSLYQDASRSAVWGNTVGTDTVAGTGNGSAQSMTVYGRAPAAQYPGAGAYSDTVTLTVAY